MEIIAYIKVVFAFYQYFTGELPNSHGLASVKYIPYEFVIIDEYVPWSSFIGLLVIYGTGRGPLVGRKQTPKAMA